MSKANVGVLLLHGLSSHINCIDPVVPRLEKYGIPYRMPFLRGHGTQPSDLVGVKWQDWVEDGQKAFDDLLTECEKVILVGLSMGGVVALNLTIYNQPKVAALVCVVPALRLNTPLLPLVPLIARFQKVRRFKFDPKGYYDLEQAKTSQNYSELPTSSIVELIRMGEFTSQPQRLHQIQVPALILQARYDRTVAPRVAQNLYDSLASHEKKLVWFDRTGHEILRDAQREEVLDHIEAFVIAHANLGQTEPVEANKA